ncbi:MAG: tetraacyldisaccharide 4'-kinase [Bacteroidales bacterium]|nr:tetraacyldisaccharide 4'-kinase [Bacteroidales bacterium]
MVKLLLFPISALWSLIMKFRRYFFNLKGRTSYKKPIIGVGNLCVGGSGKTPHVEYLIRLLSKDNNITTLSRGYGRLTKGFFFADSKSTVYQVGDEPLSYYKKYPSISVAVCEDRVLGINTILQKIPDTDVIILDDAYQHLSVKAGLNILLTDYYHIYPKDYVIPMGKLREPVSAAKEADIIIVTKCPKVLLPIEEQFIRENIQPQPHQKLYFSYIEFGQLQPLTKPAMQMNPALLRSVVSITGIANPYPFLEYIRERYSECQELTFPDHHRFSRADLEKAKQYFHRSLSRQVAIFTTEKDAVRLKADYLDDIVSQLPIFYLPIEVKFHARFKQDFENQIIDYVAKNK